MLPLQDIVDILKFDIESDEWPLFPTLTRDGGGLRNVKQIMFEIHFHYVQNERRKRRNYTAWDLAAWHRTLAEIEMRGFLRWKYYHNVKCYRRSYQTGLKHCYCQEHYYINTAFLH